MLSREFVKFIDWLLAYKFVMLIGYKAELSGYSKVYKYNFLILHYLCLQFHNDSSLFFVFRLYLNEITRGYTTLLFSIEYYKRLT